MNDLVRRSDLIARVEQMRERNAPAVELAAHDDDYPQAYEDALLDVLDVLTGWCSNAPVFYDETDEERRPW